MCYGKKGEEEKVKGIGALVGWGGLRGILCMGMSGRV
jgi:hypothetical protein